MKAVPASAAHRRPGSRPGRRRLTLVALCTAVLIAQIDTSVVNLAVWSIGPTLGSLSDVNTDAVACNALRLGPYGHVTARRAS